MKIKLHLNLGTNDFPDRPLQAGIHDVEDSFAEKLIAQRLASPVMVKAKTVAVADPDATTMQGAPLPATIEKPVKTQANSKPKTNGD